MLGLGRSTYIHFNRLPKLNIRPINLNKKYELIKFLNAQSLFVLVVSHLTLNIAETKFIFTLGLNHRLIIHIFCLKFLDIKIVYAKIVPC